MIARNHSKSYDPVGKCIYCGSATWSSNKDRKLGDEHIVPEGIGGNLVLPEASCKKCEGITSACELEWLRGSLYVARVQKGLGKKKKRSPISIPLEVERNGQATSTNVPIEKFPAMAVTLKFGPPGILAGSTPQQKVLSGGVALGILPTFGQMLNPYLAQGKVTFVPPRKGATSTHLGRILAKIAHSYVVAELGLDGFDPYLNKIILGTDTSYLPHYVGGNDELPDPIASVFEISLDVNEVSLCVVKIRLLADLKGMPEYLVVAGKKRGATNAVN